MKIIIAVNKTYPRNGKQELDMGIFYLLFPLTALGHEVIFYDTVSPEEPDFDKIVESFEPNLIFCCFTGNPYITPFEPWESIAKLTKEGKVRTFNWFCDDTWRFDDFSKHVCWYFNYCSTPEPSFVNKYKEIGYENIMLGPWYANSELYPETEKDIELSFVGGMNEEREKFFSRSKVPVTTAEGLSVSGLFDFYCRSKVGINLSVNANDPEKKTQMKQRIFELAAARSVVLTEYHEGIEKFFHIDKEIVTFTDVDDFEKKVNYLHENPEEAKKIASNGHKRFLRDHESKVRLAKMVSDIVRLDREGVR